MSEPTIAAVEQAAAPLVQDAVTAAEQALAPEAAKALTDLREAAVARADKVRTDVPTLVDQATTQVHAIGARLLADYQAWIDHIDALLGHHPAPPAK